MSKVKVSIVPVDLGTSVATIISDEIVSLTKENREQLEILRQVATATAKLRDQKVNIKRDATDAVQRALEAAHARLLEAGAAGVASDAIMALVRPFIATAPAFTLRMKTYLRVGGNQHSITRVKNNYLLIPYNADDNSQPT